MNSFGILQNIRIVYKGVSMEIKIFILIVMVFCHTVADYNLQGWLASAKQKSYWEENASESMYRYDYIMALIMHSISWSFMIMFPLMIYQLYTANSLIMTFIIFALNIFLHAQIDNMKANAKQINLIQDQLMHLFCIFGSWFLVLMI